VYVRRYALLVVLARNKDDDDEKKRKKAMDPHQIFSDCSGGQGLAVGEILRESDKGGLREEGGKKSF